MYSHTQPTSAATLPFTTVEFSNPNKSRSQPSRGKTTTTEKKTLENKSNPSHNFKANIAFNLVC
jgi:hypothetical protein